MDTGAGSEPRSAQELVARLSAARSELALLARGIDAGLLLDLADDALPALAETAFAAADAARAVASVATARVDATGVLRSRGILATSRWLRDAAHMGRGEARAVVARARDLDRPELAPTRAAWLHGRLRESQVREISLGLRACAAKAGGDGVVIDLIHEQGQRALLDVGTSGGDADEVAAAARRLLATVCPDGASQDEMDRYDAQHLQITLVGNRFVVRGDLDAVGGAALTLVLDRIVDCWFRDGTLPAVPVIDPRTGLLDIEATRAASAGDAQPLRRGRRDQYRAHALNFLVFQWLDGGGAGTHHGGARAHLSLHVSLADLLAGTGSGELEVPGHDSPVSVPVTTVARIGCDAELTVVVEQAFADATGENETHVVPADGDLLSDLARRLRSEAREVLWLGRTRRHVTARQWRYLVARDRHCQFPGCYVDASRCRPHHVRWWWAHSGPTDVDNLLLLCETHLPYFAPRRKLRAAQRGPSGARGWMADHHERRVSRGLLPALGHPASPSTTPAREPRRLRNPTAGHRATSGGRRCARPGEPDTMGA